MRTILMVVVLAAWAVPAGAQDRLADQLRKGIADEETGQNLEKAIQAYQAIVTRYDEDRKVAGSALFRLADCYRKLGKREPAIAAYQRLLREFGDQQAMAEASRQQLAALGAAGVKEVRPERVPRDRAERPREVVPERAPAAGEVPTGTLAETRLALQDIDNQFARAKQLIAKGLMAPADVEALRTRQQILLLKMRQQEAQVQLTQEMIASVQKEIALVQQQITGMEAKAKVGTGPADDPQLLQLRRDLLGLQRRLAELQMDVRRLR